MLLPVDLLGTIAILSLGRIANAATASEWASRSIYQVMTDRFALSDGSAPECDLLRYCGGTWTGIKNKLDYIQGMGFSAIQISPVVKNLPNNTIYGEAFHGYWPTDWYALNENFGTAEDLKGLAKALHDRDMLFMVDVVINDVAVAIEKDMTADTVLDYSQFRPFDDKKYFHPWCNLTSYDNITESQDCWLGSSVVALSDLNTEDPVVVGMVNKWIKELVSDYSIDGLRIDAAKHVDDAFLQSFVEAAGVFTFGEVFNQKIDLMCAYTKFLDSMPNFGTYFPMMEAFAYGNMTVLGQAVEEVGKACKNITQLGTFSENHDLPRFPSLNPDLMLSMNAIAFTILADGIPTMYQNQEQHVSGKYPPHNRGALWTTGYNTTSPLYNLTHTLNALRSHAAYTDPSYIRSTTTKLHLRDQYYITRKGSEGSQVVAAFFNSGNLSGILNATVTVKGAFKPKTKVVEVVRCVEMETDGEGDLKFRIDGVPKAFYGLEGLEGSGLCGRKFVRVVKNEEGKGGEVNGTKEGKGEGEKKSEAVSMLLRVRVNFAGGALGALFLGALVWL